MKVAAIPPKCTPGHGAAQIADGKTSAHVPLRRAAARRRLDEAAKPERATGAQARDPLAVHSAPEGAPQVLHIDNDAAAAQALAQLLMPEARVTHAPTLAAARELLQQRIFSAVVLDPNLPDGNGAELLGVLTGTPLLVYSASQPDWRGRSGVFLPKPWTSPRQLWSTISRLLGIPTLTFSVD